MQTASAWVLHCREEIMMKFKHIITALCVVLAAMVVACGGEKSSGHVALTDEVDSMSYIVGMNIGYNLLQMDTTLRREAIIKGLNDALKGSERISADDARTFFLAYMNYGVYERVRNYEEQYLTDLEAADKDVQRTRSGLTYKVAELGDMNTLASSDRDTVSLIYTASRMSGEEVDIAAEREDTVRVALRNLVPGLKEGVKLIGEGGKITLWIPSAQAFGPEGDEAKGIKPNEMLRYELELIDVKKRR